MKTSEFQQKIGGTLASMNRLKRGMKGCYQLSSNETYCDDS